MMRITLTDQNGSLVGAFDYDAEPHERAVALHWGGLTYRQQSYTDLGGWVYQAVNEPPNMTPGFNSVWLYQVPTAADPVAPVPESEAETEREPEPAATKPARTKK